MFRSKLQICFFLNHPIVLCYKVPIPPSRLRRATVPQCGIVNPRRSQAHSRLSLPYWGLRTGLRFAGPVFRGCGALRAVPQFSMVVPLRSQARLRHSLLHWAYYGLFRALRAASVRPSPLHPFGASTTTACFRHWRRPSCAPFEPSVAATPRHLPFKKGGITGGIGQCYFLRLCHYPKGSFV